MVKFIFFWNFLYVLVVGRIKWFLYLFVIGKFICRYLIDREGLNLVGGIEL